MKRILIEARRVLFFSGLVASLFLPGCLQAQSFDAYLVKTLDLLATRALSAYNK